MEMPGEDRSVDNTPFQKGIVYFYSYMWRFLAHAEVRKSFTDLLSDMTGVPILTEAITGSMALRDFTILFGLQSETGIHEILATDLLLS